MPKEDELMNTGGLLAAVEDDAHAMEDDIKEIHEQEANDDEIKEVQRSDLSKSSAVPTRKLVMPGAVLDVFDPEDEKDVLLTSDRAEMLSIVPTTTTPAGEESLRAMEAGLRAERRGKPVLEPLTFSSKGTSLAQPRDLESQAVACDESMKKKEKKEKKREKKKRKAEEAGEQELDQLAAESKLEAEEQSSVGLVNKKLDDFTHLSSVTSVKSPRQGAPASGLDEFTRLASTKSVSPRLDVGGALPVIQKHSSSSSSMLNPAKDNSGLGEFTRLASTKSRLDPAMSSLGEPKISSMPDSRNILAHASSKSAALNVAAAPRTLRPIDKSRLRQTGRDLTNNFMEKK
jgi:hypothetical protein